MKIAIPFYSYMNLKKIIKYFSFSIIILISGIIFLKYIYPFKKNPNNKTNTILNNYAVYENNENGKMIDDIRLTNEKGDTLFLSNLAQQNKIIYRISELHCNSCVVHEFDNLKKSIPSNKNLLILSYYQNPRNLIIFKRINNLKDFEIYNLMDENIQNLIIDKYGTPYMFIIDKHLKISNLFIPLKTDNQRTIDYLKRVSTLLK